MNFFPSKKGAGYGSVADALNQSAELALKAGEKGYVALEALMTGDLVKAKDLGEEAFAEATKAMKALPETDAIPVGVITSLKKACGHI